MTQEFVTLPRHVAEHAVASIEMLNTGKWAQVTALAAALRAALDQPQGEQPAMTPIAQRKLDSLLAEGYTISGYSVYHEQKHQHGFVTGAGLVGWWKPEGVEYPQPQGEQEHVAFGQESMRSWSRSGTELVKRMTRKAQQEYGYTHTLYLHPQNLNCKSAQARLATLWGCMKADQNHFEQEPIARVAGTGDAGGHFNWYTPGLDSPDLPVGALLYTHPQPKRKPLANEQIIRMWHDYAKGVTTSRTLPFEWYRLGIRHAEHHHNIK